MLKGRQHMGIFAWGSSLITIQQLATPNLPQACELLFEVGDLPLHEAVANEHLHEERIRASGPCRCFLGRGHVLKGK